MGHFKGEMGSQGSWVKGPRSRALAGLGPDRAQARLVQSLVLDIGQRYKTKNLVRGHGPRNDLVSSINNYGTAKIRLNMSISREQQCILLQLVCKAFKHSSIFKRFPSFSLIHMLNRLRVPKCHEVARLWPLATE